jgi:hypothetical protein
VQDGATCADLRGAAEQLRLQRLVLRNERPRPATPAVSSMVYIACYLLHVACCVRIACGLLRVACHVRSVARRRLHAKRCALHVACCMLHATRRTLQHTHCRLVHGCRLTSPEGSGTPQSPISDPSDLSDLSRQQPAVAFERDEHRRSNEYPIMPLQLCVAIAPPSHASPPRSQHVVCCPLHVRMSDVSLLDVAAS